MFKTFITVDGKQVILNINQIVYIIPCTKNGVKSLAFGLCLNCDDDLSVWHIDPECDMAKALLVHKDVPSIP